MLPTLAIAAFTAVLLACHWLWDWVPILDSANLVFHEAGHPIIGIFSRTLEPYGGTIMQLAIPGAVIWELRRQKQLLGMWFAVVWMGENLFNVARYMADARAQVLPLVGGGNHDWAHILGSWGLINQDTALAMLLRIGALGLMAWAIWQVWLLYRPAPPEPESQVERNRRLREQRRQRR